MSRFRWPPVNYATLEKVDSVASHILVFMLRSIVNHFKFSLANFAMMMSTMMFMLPTRHETCLTPMEESSTS